MYDYFGFLSGSDYCFYSDWELDDNLTVKGAQVPLEDENGDMSLVTFDFHAIMGYPDCSGVEILETDIDFAAGTFPLPGGLDQAHAKEMILDCFDPYQHPRSA